MATLVLKIREGCGEVFVEFHVDGEDLGARIMADLGDEGFDDVLPWFGGDYQIKDTVLGDAARQDGVQNAIMLACGCGHFACSGVSADVVANAETITFSNFSTWRHGRRIVAAVEPVSFDRRQFESALAKLYRDVAEWRPSPPGTEVPPRIILIPPPA
ncbi:hypothetical protein [Humisphaera borealis]|uniref:Uncharacterized protein n=1 Tax=Humisphaera borealis TaxID=2807512 RepID=A0A7M2WR73_9BACT|nr:hypothetical protein [Humisphaera borealis]QOV87301.1 hypothetical protein IPV69_13465 [Humisphaera borealis]